MQRKKPGIVHSSARTQDWPHHLFTPLSCSSTGAMWLSVPVADHSALVFQDSYLTNHPPLSCLSQQHALRDPFHTSLAISFHMHLETVALRCLHFRRRPWKAICLTPGCWWGSMPRSPRYCSPSLNGSFLKLLLFPKQSDFGEAPFSISHCTWCQTYTSSFILHYILKRTQKNFAFK